MNEKEGIAVEDLQFMDEALELARQAMAEGEVPVGCVIVRNGEIVGGRRQRPPWVMPRSRPSPMPARTWEVGGCGNVLSM